ncbi:hypothetical protein QJQ45_008500, partial [Haematococcus lacustris]
MAASGAVKEAVWLRKLMQDLGLPGTCVNIMCDNQAALQLLNNPMASARSKHISVHHHFARERAARGEVMFTYCSTLEMVADVMTKPLAAVKLGLHDDLAAYMAATTLLPTKTPSATRALAAYRTSAGKPRSVAPAPQRPTQRRSQMQQREREETAAQMVASMFDAYPEGRVLGPASAQLSNLSMITLRDVHYTEGNLS